ncbi:hypothetical protein [Parathalassolituus penaei]|uniref:Rap1a immunity protein domain-containing protein n=1 Tax=Parathalassolituus penaei TaxID=2997323 RepID=A0A9X3ECQ4_9GAMM|nr:hypothetical protein [Parathalassolituus penaei]MCY0965162.1 hypothetical protein [Parathalassolituus penaei]
MKKYILLILLTIFSGQSIADEDTERLLEGCKLLAKMYDSNNDINILNSLTLSPADTMMAGYCKGMVDAFLQFGSWQYCNHNNWHKVAKRIASIESSEILSDNSDLDVKDILKEGCR